MMKHFRGKPVVLDIYGAGDLKDTLPNYHAMIMSSFYEGFSIGVLEAMAMKIPLVLSDIPSFREQCEN
ncbi:glycosyltransferase, partial [Salmonella enterica]|uniref:glycosyltransferase n=1 Tax=Salmonella enterica TaxID=28901 RepID=UPI003CF17F58